MRKIMLNDTRPPSGESEKLNLRRVGGEGKLINAAEGPTRGDRVLALAYTRECLSAVRAAGDEELILARARARAHTV